MITTIVTHPPEMERGVSGRDSELEIGSHADGRNDPEGFPSKPLS